MTRELDQRRCRSRMKLFAQKPALKMVKINILKYFCLSLPRKDFYAILNVFGIHNGFYRSPLVLSLLKSLLTISKGCANTFDFITASECGSGSHVVWYCVSVCSLSWDLALSWWKITGPRGNRAGGEIGATVCWVPHLKASPPCLKLK